MLFLDVDDLKVINDSLGHEAGDTMLQVAAQRLQQSVRTEDVVARLGGDEFVAMLFGSSPRDVLDRLSERMHAALAEPMRIGDTTLRITASIGIAPIAERDTRDAAAILRDADLAMYQAKRLGRGKKTAYFSAELVDSNGSA